MFAGGVNFKKHGSIEHAKFNITRYYELADEILEYSKKYVTSEAVASYLLKSLGAENARHILLVARGPYDYLEATVAMPGISSN
jgi:hypothetical protein